MLEMLNAHHEPPNRIIALLDAPAVHRAQRLAIIAKRTEQLLPELLRERLHRHAAWPLLRIHQGGPAPLSPGQAVALFELALDLALRVCSRSGRRRRAMLEAVGTGCLNWAMAQGQEGTAHAE